MQSWREMPEFYGVDLEDSEILGWRFEGPPGTLVIQLRARVLAGHPAQAHHPASDRPAELVFETITRVEGLLPPIATPQHGDEPPRVDTLANLCRHGDGGYAFDASWGIIRVYSDQIRLRFHDETRAAA
jgi:hypothetical protein